MSKVTVDLVKYDMDKTTKRKRVNFVVDSKTEAAVIQKLEKIHKGEKVQKIHELVWGEEKVDKNLDSEILTGRIKFYDTTKGFGFIQPDVDMDDLFFHASALGGEVVVDNDFVQFEIGTGTKGDIAIHIKVVDIS